MHHENEKMALFEALYREYLVPLKKYAYRIGVGYDDPSTGPRRGNGLPQAQGPSSRLAMSPVR